MTIKVFPALAGVILQWQKLLDQKLSFSRTRGGDPSLWIAGYGFSRTRGGDPEFPLCEMLAPVFFPHTRG